MVVGRRYTKVNSWLTLMTILNRYYRISPLSFSILVMLDQYDITMHRQWLLIVSGKCKLLEIRKGMGKNPKEIIRHVLWRLDGKLSRNITLISNMIHTIKWYRIIHSIIILLPLILTLLPQGQGESLLARINF